MTTTRQRYTVYTDNPAYNPFHSSPSSSSRPHYSAGFALTRGQPDPFFQTLSRFKTLSARDPLGRCHPNATLERPSRSDLRNFTSETDDGEDEDSRRISWVSESIEAHDRRLIGRPHPITMPQPNTVVNSTRVYARPPNITTFPTPGQTDHLPLHRHPPHQGYKGGQAYFSSPPMWAPDDPPNEVTGMNEIGTSSPGNSVAHHSSISIRSWVPIGTSTFSVDPTGTSEMFSPRPAFAEPAYIEYAAVSNSSYRMTTGAATSHGSTSECHSVLVYEVNTLKAEPIRRPAPRFPSYEPFPLHNDAARIQTVQHDPKPKPCKGHGFRHWLHTQFRRHRCQSDH
ncbi:hypothetical protein FRC02_003622 [Tulasnella sp. 418]|nr:hypothetical protein FRC02_003622 [Tulasnella sp. 418]